MAYLQLSDYTISISIEHLNEILEQAAFTSGLSETQVRIRHEALSQSLITSYLKAKYLIDDELAKIPPVDPAPDTRDPIILSLAVELALCSLHKTINPRDIPELREKACDSAKQMLTDLRDGLMSLNVVELNPTPDYEVSQIGSQIKFISKPFSDASLIEE